MKTVTITATCSIVHLVISNEVDPRISIQLPHVALIPWFLHDLREHCEFSLRFRDIESIELFLAWRNSVCDAADAASSLPNSQNKTSPETPTKEKAYGLETKLY